MIERVQEVDKKKWRAATEYKRFIWGPIRAFKKSIKSGQKYCIRIIKKVVRGWR